MKNTVNTAGVVRIVLYVIGALCGLAAVILPLAGIDHLTGLLAALAGAAATITGGTAVYNVPKAKDQKQDLSIAEIGGALLSVIREGQALVTSKPDNTAGEVPVEYEVPGPGAYEGKNRAKPRFSLYE